MWDDSGQAVIAALAQLNRDSAWAVGQQQRLGFPCYHTQGIARAGDRLFLSSVEITRPPTRFAVPVNGFDRDPGAGRAHLFEVDVSGRLLNHLTLGEGAMYHPGGIDVDAEGWLRVPVAEYRPDSQAIVYRIDVRTMEISEAFRFPDHLGGIVHDPDSGHLHAVTWGSRRLLTLTTEGAVLHQATNQSHLVDFQGCVTVHDGGMVCTGVTEYQNGAGAVFQLGSAAVIDVTTGYIRLEVPVTAVSPHGRVLTYNAVHLEVDRDRLRMLVVDEGRDGTDGQLITLETPLR